ncbi:MAG: hypothetical protein DRI44_09275 [Chlamydiae bacterium]|nr:MAG: hypothetical protein DRI44_09275 [Chlamydiota bacterium]
MGPLSALIEIFQSLDIAGKLIIFVLAIISVYMWGLIFAKLLSMKTIDLGNEKIYKRLRGFNAQFARDFLQLFRDFPKSSSLPLHKLYRVCCDNLLTREKIRPEAIIATEKLLDSYIAEEVITLEEGMNFLSVTSTIAPFLGLLGTVWGIMVMFRKMTQAGSSTISTVAPGISVALTTTIAGLVVAIPAAIFYYYFRGRVNKQLVLMEKFSRELMTKLQNLILEEQEL